MVFHLFDDRLRWKATRVLARLCEKMNSFPGSLFLRHVSLVQQDAITGGGYADIYMGHYRDRHVSLKRLRVFASDEERQLVQWVCDACCISHLHTLTLPNLAALLP